ncbi:MAG: cupin domain-containing protein [Candidatus Thorarchaeota archaeon]
MFLTKDVKSEDYPVYHHPGMKGVYRKQFLNPENSAKTFALRAYIIESGGHTSHDVHSHEHGVYMLSGEATVIVGDKEVHLKSGDVLHIGSDEPHQFFNNGLEPVKFLCVRDFTSSS